MKDIYMIRGAPGVGKSALGRRLKKALPKGFVIEVDAVRGMINGVQWVNTEEHFHALTATLGIVNAYLVAGYQPAVVIDTFNPSKLKWFVAHLSDGIRFQIISLYAEPNVLEQRVNERVDGFKDLGKCHILNDEVKDYRHTNEQLIDTSYMDKEAVLQVCLNIINHG